MTLQDAIDFTGGLSETDKMPWYSYNLPAHACVTGCRLRKKANTVCSRCYAHRGRYTFRNTLAAMDRRLIACGGTRWAEAMIFLLNSKLYRSRSEEPKFFRWHDSGDIQSPLHLMKIFDICNGTPQLRHWLPTKERTMVETVIRKRPTVPANLVIRLSAHYIDEPCDRGDLGLPSAVVYTERWKVKGIAHFCPAREQGHKCGSCRACWDPAVKQVAFPLTGGRG